MEGKEIPDDQRIWMRMEKEKNETVPEIFSTKVSTVLIPLLMNKRIKLRRSTIEKLHCGYSLLYSILNRCLVVRFLILSTTILVKQSYVFVCYKTTDIVNKARQQALTVCCTGPTTHAFLLQLIYNVKN